MPGFNQRGPDGQGTMTGRIMGLCTTYGANPKNQNTTPSDKKIEGQSEKIPGKGFGFGHGRGAKDRSIGFQNRHRGGF